MPNALVTDLPATKSRAEHTRVSLMAAAFNEIYAKGYQAASLNAILEAAGATKGALYHHFADKKALALSACETFIRQFQEEHWYAPLRVTDDPITTLENVVRTFALGATEEDLRLGCPIVNLSREIAKGDPEFQDLISRLMKEWRDILADAIRRGQAAGNVRTDIDPMGVAFLLLAMRDGVIQQVQVTQDLNLKRVAGEASIAFFQTLRPPAPETKTKRGGRHG